MMKANLSFKSRHKLLERNFFVSRPFSWGRGTTHIDITPACRHPHQQDSGLLSEERKVLFHVHTHNTLCSLSIQPQTPFEFKRRLPHSSLSFLLGTELKHARYNMPARAIDPSSLDPAFSTRHSLRTAHNSHLEMDITSASSPAQARSQVASTIGDEPLRLSHPQSFPPTKVGAAFPSSFLSPNHLAWYGSTRLRKRRAGPGLATRPFPTLLFATPGVALSVAPEEVKKDEKSESDGSRHPPLGMEGTKRTQVSLPNQGNNNNNGWDTETTPAGGAR